MSSFAPYLPRLLRDWPGGPVLETEGTLVSVDLSGFTRLSERLQAKGRAGAEELVLAVSGVFQGLIGICERHDGDVLKFRGDALLLFFSGEGHERRACLAASHMQWLIGVTGKTMSSVGSVTLRMSTGIHTGTCHFFLVDGTHRELLVTGPAATATIRLESNADAGQILVGDGTARALEPAWLGAARPGGRLLRKIDEEDVAAHLAARAAPSREDLAEFVPLPLRAHLLLEAGEAEHRQVTAAFLKFGAVDELIAEAGTGEAWQRLAQLARVVGETADEFGLTWLESDIDAGGGKLYLVGGAPSSTGADEERMLRALRAILDGCDALPLRAGINRGPAFCGDIGADTRRTYAVMGDTVNLAARLVSRAEPGQILATADVLDRSRTRYETSAQPFLMKGKDRPITAYAVGTPTGVKDEDVAVELPLVGRDGELAAISLAVGAARTRQQQLLELVGEPGIGKSRLVDEVTRQAVGFTQLVGRCDPYSSSSPYHVLRTVLRPLAGITEEMDAEEAGRALEPWMRAVMPDLAPWLPLLAIAFGAEVEATPETEAITPRFRRERLQDAVEQFLTRVLMMPTLLVIEDAHWIDDASRELLRKLTRGAAPRPWLVCVTRRPQGEPIAVDDVQGHLRIELEPLAAGATQALVLAAAGSVAFAPEAVAALVERSGGNPLFVRELVAASRGGAGGVATLPDSVETVILSRIDTLAPEDRFLLRNASVIGARFELELLAETLRPELEDVGDLARWDRLSEFVAWDGSGELRFQHDLFRTVAYEGLSFRRRAQMHARVAEALERRAGENADEAAALLSLHFEWAQEHERAWRYSVIAGKRAQAGFANVDAVELYSRALAVGEEAGATDAELAEVAEALGDVAEIAARFVEAADAYGRARKLVGDDMLALTRLLRKEGVVRERLGRYSEALRWYGRALKALDRVDDEAASANRVELELAYAGVKHRQGRFADAVEWGTRAAEHAEAIESRSAVAHAYYLLDLAYSRLGQRDNPYRGLSLAIYEETADLWGQTRVLNNLGVDAYYEGRWDDSLDYYRRCGEIADRAGDVILLATATNNIAEIQSDQGLLEEAREGFEEALRVFRAAQYRMGAAIVTSNLGRVAARAGRFDEAHTLLEDALAEVQELGADALVAETRARLAECLVLEGRYREATATLAPLLAEGGGPMVERLAGYAVVQSRAPFAKAKPHFDAALEAARTADAQYELALTLRAVAETSGADAKEAAAILERLGVVSTPSVPLP